MISGGGVISKGVTIFGQQNIYLRISNPNTLNPSRWLVSFLSPN